MTSDCSSKQTDDSDALQNVRKVLASINTFYKNESRMHETYTEMQDVAQQVLQNAAEEDEELVDKIAYTAVRCGATHVRSSQMSASEKKLALKKVSYCLPSRLDPDEFPAEAALWITLLEDPLAAMDGLYSNTGHVIWPACEALCRHLARQTRPEAPIFQNNTVLELGSGLGALGLYAAIRCGAQRTLLTDVADALPLLEENMLENRALLCDDAEMEVFALDWKSKELPQRVREFLPMDVILAADVVYSAPMVPYFLQTTRRCSGPGTCIMVSCGHRPGEVERFIDCCAQAGFSIISHVEYDPAPNAHFADPFRASVFELRRIGDLDLMD